MIAAKNQKIDEIVPIDLSDQREIEKRGKPIEQLISIPLKEEDSLRVLQLGSLLTRLGTN